jgi:recombination protein RecT
MVTIAISRTPRLRECTPLSLLQGCLDAALCGCVSIGGPGARGYLIPYKNGQLSRQAGCTVYEAQFQSSYLGLCDMARRSKEIAFIDAFPVFRGDRFEYSQGFESKLVHVPNPDPKADRSKDALIYVYAIARYRAHSLPQFRVLTMAEVEEHRARSRAANDGPWVTDYIPMALKTAVRVLAKWLPQTPEMQDQLSREADVEFVDANVVELPDLEPGESRTENLADRLTGEVIAPTTGEVQPTSPADPATQAEAARQVQALRDATLPEPQEAPADFDDGHDFNTK